MITLPSLEIKTYQNKIYLNDRPYHILDTGEGPCCAHLVDSIAGRETEVLQANDDKRNIYIDLSLAWGKNVASLPSEQLEYLTEDIHLLLDVFWLEELTIHSCIDELNMDKVFSIIKQKEYSKELYY
ncbi:hypothetical protein [Vibrio astriarenae]|uniref:hypothetical protein n=1 Tax=Vibrio astriarenae TaxID=1481923 RepID=UPI00373622B3